MRAFLALVLHICFFAVPLCLVLGLFSIAAYIAPYSTGSALRAALAALLVSAVLSIGMRAILRCRRRPIGVEIDKPDQPRLWKIAQSVASAVGLDPLGNIRITTEPRARIREETSLLGLRIRTRHLEIGLPLLAALNVSELQAALALEMGRLGRGKPTTVRRIAGKVDHTATTLVGGPTKFLFNGYARVFRAVASPVRLDVEERAPVIAAKIAGKRVTGTTLQKLTAVRMGWTEYSREYLSMAKTMERAPDVLAGFRSFMEHPERKPALADRAKRAIAEQADEPERITTREHLATVKRLPKSSNEPERDEHPALALLREPRETVPELERQLMAEHVGGRMPWPEVVQKAGAQRVAQQAALLSSAVSRSGLSDDPALGAILPVIHRGEVAELVNPVLNPGLDPEHIQDAVVDTMTELLGDTIVDALVSTGRAHHELNWGGPSIVRLTHGHPLDPDRLVRPAVTDPSLIPGLHRTLVDMGVPLNHSRPPAAEPQPVLAGIASPVHFAGQRSEMLVTDRGLLFLPAETNAVRHLLTGVLARLRAAENERLADLAGIPIENLREAKDAQWLDSRDVASARLSSRDTEWSLSLELYLDEYSMSGLDSERIGDPEGDTATVEVRSARDCAEHGDPYGGLGDVMGARMTREAGDTPRKSPNRPKSHVENYA